MTESLSVAVLYQGTCRCWRNLHQKQWGCRTALGMTGGKDKTQWARKTETPSVWYSLDKVLTWSWPGSIMLYTCKLPRLLVRPLLLSVHLQKPSACVLPRSPKNTHTQRFSLSLSRWAWPSEEHCAENLRELLAPPGQSSECRWSQDVLVAWSLCTERAFRTNKWKPKTIQPQDTTANPHISHNPQWTPEPCCSMPYAQ